MLELFVEPVAPVEPELGLDDGVVEGGVLGVVLDVVLEVLGVVADTLPLVEPVPVAPIDEVVLGDVLPLAVVESVVVLEPVVVLGDVLPLMPPEPVDEPVVVDGVVVLLPVVVLLEFVPLAPVVLVSELRWQALSESAAAIATATAVNLVFIRTP